MPGNLDFFLNNLFKQLNQVIIEELIHTNTINISGMYTQFIYKDIKGKFLSNFYFVLCININMTHLKPKCSREITKCSTSASMFPGNH